MTLVEKLYEDLREAIVVGRYQSGERLKAEHIKVDFGVSGGTVREVLNRLISDGLVVPSDRRGFSVAPLTTANLDDIIRARLLVEIDVLRSSITNGDDAWEVKLVGAYHQLSKQESLVDIEDELSLRHLESANRTFHDCLVSASPSPILIGFYQQLFNWHYRYRRIALRNLTILKKAKRDHKGLLDAALNRDVGSAIAIATKHISRAGRFSAEMLSKN